MRILVTGGSGFIGQHLVQRFLSQGHELLVVDHRHLHMPAERLGFDVRDTDRLIGESHLFKPDGIIHLASTTDIARGAVDLDGDFTSILEGTHSVLKACVAAGVKRLLYVSSSAVYGLPILSEQGGYKPFTERDRCLPVSLYGACKLGAEALVTAFSHTHGLVSTILRLTNVVGPHMNRGVIHDLVRKLKADSCRLEVLGDGRQKKCYVHVRDLVDALALLLEAKQEWPCDVYNVSTDTYVTVMDIVEMVVQKLGTEKTQIVLQGGPTGWIGDVPQIMMSGDKLKKAGWSGMSSSFAARHAVGLAAEELAQ